MGRGRFVREKKALNDFALYGLHREGAKAGVPKGRSPHGLRKASCRRLAEAGCQPHEIMPVSGHTTLKVESYTKAANRSRLAGNAMATLQNARREHGSLGKRDIELANVPEDVSQRQGQGIDFIYEKKQRMAEREGFEPSIRLRVFRFSRPAYSTTLAPLHPKCVYRRRVENPALRIQLCAFGPFGLDIKYERFRQYEC